MKRDSHPSPLRDGFPVDHPGSTSQTAALELSPDYGDGPFREGQTVVIVACVDVADARRETAAGRGEMVERLHHG